MYAENSIPGRLTTIRVASAQITPVGKPARILGVSLNGSGTLGKITFRNGNVAGTIVGELSVRASLNEVYPVMFPAKIDCADGIYVEIDGNVTSYSLFYDGEDV